MNNASLSAHMERIHGEPCVVPPELPEAFRASHQPRACAINWPRVHKKWKCPVERCPCKASANANFHNHFMCRHPCDSIHIADESPEPWPKCEPCGLQCPFPALRSHAESATCAGGRITKRSRDTANKILQADEQVFTIDGAPEESVGSFRHPGRQETRTDSDWGALCADLRRARCKWHKLSKLLHGEGADPMIFGMFCKAAVQTALLHGCESWTLTDTMWTVLKGFHHRAVGRMTDVTACRGPRGGWICPSLEEALEKAGVRTMERCVSKRQQRTVDCISTRPIWMHCMATRRQPGSSPKTVCWWDQKRRQAKPVDEHGEDGALGLQRP